MQMTASDQTGHPKLKQYIRDNLPKVADVPVIRDAMFSIGEINHAKLRQVLKWGQGPVVKVANLIGALGEFTPDVGSNEIRVDAKLVAEFERNGAFRNAKAGRVSLMGVTILHELIHWGDDQDGIDRPGEEGEEFERKIYGRVIT